MEGGSCGTRASNLVISRQGATSKVDYKYASWMNSRGPKLRRSPICHEAKNPASCSWLSLSGPRHTQIKRYLTPNFNFNLKNINLTSRTSWRQQQPVQRSRRRSGRKGKASNSFSSVFLSLRNRLWSHDIFFEILTYSILQSRTRPNTPSFSIRLLPISSTKMFNHTAWLPSLCSSTDSRSMVQ